VIALTKPEVVAAAGAELGEGPVWDAARNCLWFVDIKRKRLYRFDPTSRVLDSWQAPQQIGWVVPSRDGRLLCGLQDGLYWLDPESGQFSFWQSVEPDRPGNRLNDACCDEAGRVWFGSMNDDEAGVTGHYYRLSGGAISRVGPGPFAITNGPAVSPDGRRIYFTDSANRRIWVADIDRAGDVGPHRLFRQFEEADGHPDGPVVDSAGNVWSAMFGGWGVRCLSPAGEDIGLVPLPVANITKVAFGGLDLKTAYTTTAKLHLNDQERKEQPLAGHVFAFAVDVPGAMPGLVREGQD
jgi:xylono-1,5-lactonase